MNQRLPIDALRALQTVVELASVTRAAERLNLCQSAVSWKIKRLETQLGRTLTRRDGQQLVATADGEALLIHARRIIDSHDEALAHFTPSTLKGCVRLGATEQMPLTQLAPLLARFSRQHAQVEVRLVIDQSQVLRAALVHGELDLAIHQDFAHLLDSEDHLLWGEKIHWCVPPGWQHSPGTVIPLVTFGPDCYYRRLAEELIQSAGLRSRIAVECPSAEGVLSAIACGLGIGLVNRGSIDGRVEINPLLERQMPLPEVSNVLRYGKQPNDPTVMALHQMLTQALGGRAASRDIEVDDE